MYVNEAALIAARYNKTATQTKRSLTPVGKSLVGLENKIANTRKEQLQYTRQDMPR
jgi:ATP-dependent Zn protease